MSLIIFVLVCYGATQIFCYGKIFDSIRPTKEEHGMLGELFKCFLCMGFWIGILAWLLSSFTTLFSFDGHWITGLLLGCLSSGTSYFLDKLVGDKGININNENK